MAYKATILNLRRQTSFFMLDYAFELRFKPMPLGLMYGSVAQCFYFKLDLTVEAAVAVGTG